MSYRFGGTQMPASHPAGHRSRMSAYRQALIDRYWVYQQHAFPDLEATFDPAFIRSNSPPVFLVSQASKNLLVRPAANVAETSRLLVLIGERHRRFASMNSSQALAQSVLGNLAVYDHLDILADLLDDEGEPLLGSARPTRDNFVMEHKITYLGERRSTRLDAFFSGDYQVAIECKFTEGDFGARSPQDPLSASRAKYWTYIPELFLWEGDAPRATFPLDRYYQLVRNVLAACVRSDGTIAPERGHVLVAYDERNPAFQVGGKALAAFAATSVALKFHGVLRKCSWQRIIAHLRARAILPWLTTALDQKYGL